MNVKTGKGGENESKDDELDKWVEAGKLTWEAIQLAKKRIKPGKTYLEIADEVESFIRDTGSPAFPANLSRDNEAAHYTPGIGDERVIGENDVIKVDCGAQIDGFIGDAAITLDLSGENGKLVEASETALQNALARIRAGTSSRDVSREIMDTIRGFGYEPIRNLGGHVISRWILHTGLSIPNVPGQEFTFKEGMIVAIEPFASMGSGLVHEGATTNIFSVQTKPLVRSRDARDIYSFALEKFKTLPFAERWLVERLGGIRLKLALRELVSSGSFRAYPVLIDSGTVSQSEVTVMVEKDGCKVLTR